MEQHAARVQHRHVAPASGVRANGWSLLLMSVQARLMLAAIAAGVVWAAALWTLH